MSENKDEELKEEKLIEEEAPESSIEDKLGYDEDEIDSPADEVTSEEITQSKFGPEELLEAIKSKDRDDLVNIFENIPDADIAEAAEELEAADLILLFRRAKASYTANIFDDLSQDKKEEIVTAMTDRELVTLINMQSADDVADTVDEMPANLARRVLKAADPEMRDDINHLLKYEDDTAGAIMTTEFIECPAEWTVKETIKAIRKQGKEAETVYTIFVKNKDREFVGTVDLDELIWSKEDQTLEDIMSKDAPFCHVNTDKEEVATMFRKYDLNAMAVLNEDDRLIGIVTVDDAVDVMIEESSEDLEKLNAISALDDSYLETSPVSMMKKCVPWIIVLIILGTLSSMILSVFQDRLSLLPVLAAFIPVLMDTGGNAGGQTIALMIRGLALKEFEPKHALKILGREILSAMLISLCVAGFAFIWFTMEQYTGIVHNTTADVAWLADKGMAPNPEQWGTIWNGMCWSFGYFLAVIKISAIVAGTLFITTVASKMIAVLLPLGVSAIKKDPAIVSQPLLTTIIDGTSLLIFFGIAELLVLRFI
ncbi:MAG: magnesium transporter [Bacilli bacterium]|nr:magnesium transporter [Bacilli bacterium]